jgi:ADP-ribosylglycohydrolase
MGNRRNFLDFEDYATGNGALMRIMPLAFHTLEDSREVRFKKIEEISSITHSNKRSVLACFIYTELCIQLLEGKSKVQAYKNTQDNVNAFFETYDICSEALGDFHRILKSSISTYFEDEIKASCHVVYSLEAVLWSFMKGKSYKDCVLKAVNLGEDTDTNAALTGALAAIFYGGESIPEQWIDLLPKKKEIEELADRYQKSLTPVETR